MNKVGIVSYGSYIPQYRISVEEIAHIWGEDATELKNQLQVPKKSVLGLDEDVVTMAVESARNAVNLWNGDPKLIGAIYVGSESHPYAVKPTATIVSEALPTGKEIMAADLEFACKAGTAGMQMCFGLVKSDMINYGLAIGSDDSQAKPSDPLEYTAGAGSAAILIGREGIIAELEGTYSVTSDTPDFWRREGATYPSHGQRFTGKPAYFQHTIDATKGMMNQLQTNPSDYDYVVFHQPNAKFPLSVAKMLGFTKEQVELSLVCRHIGNTYSASSMLGLNRILEKASSGERILMTSYGSGAGSDSFSFVVTDKIEELQSYPFDIEYYIKRTKDIDYGLYTRYKGLLK